jgi:hypothetical protein
MPAEKSFRLEHQPQTIWQMFYHLQAWRPRTELSMKQFRAGDVAAIESLSNIRALIVWPGRHSPVIHCAARFLVSGTDL